MIWLPCLHKLLIVRSHAVQIQVRPCLANECKTCRRTQRNLHAYSEPIMGVDTSNMETSVAIRSHTHSLPMGTLMGALFLFALGLDWHHALQERRRTKVKFHELYETFMLLSDPPKRADYDEYLGLADLPPTPSLSVVQVSTCVVLHTFLVHLRTVTMACRMGRFFIIHAPVCVPGLRFRRKRLSEAGLQERLQTRFLVVDKAVGGQILVANKLVDGY